jgi:hypothetical protein
MPVISKALADPIRRKCLRALCIIFLGIASYFALRGVVPVAAGAAISAFIIAAAYWPLTRIRCPHCKQFPFKTWLNPGPLPLLCFVSQERCRNCGRDIFRNEAGSR